jgi:hypothetical protein
MSVRIFYIDESYDPERFCLSGFSVHHSEWRSCFGAIKDYRVHLQRKYGIPLSKEIHARDLIGGRGYLRLNGTVPRWSRPIIFEGMLKVAGSMPSARLFNVCLNSKNFVNVQLTAWDRMLNRIDRTMQEFDIREERKRRKWVEQIEALNSAANSEIAISDLDMESIATRLKLFRSRAIVFSDEGREREITRAFRKMSVINHIPSQFRIWPDGKATKNIPARRIIEDPIFKPSHSSYFLQVADCVAFALLKREVAPTGNIEKWSINKMFEKHLANICFLPACAKDPLGIVRN